MSSLTCNAVLGCITQSSRSCLWRGAGPAADDSQGEFSVRQRKRGRQTERESEQESQRACSRTLPRGSACSRASTFLLFLLSSLHLSSHLYSPPSSHSVSPPTSSIISAFHLSALIALSSDPLFTLHPSSSFSSFLLSSDGVRRFFLTPPLVCPPPPRPMGIRASCR